MGEIAALVTRGEQMDRGKMNEQFPYLRSPRL